MGVPQASFKAKLVNHLAWLFVTLRHKIALRGYFLCQFFEAILGTFRVYFGPFQGIP